MEHVRIRAAIDRCYDAAVVPEDWPDALHALARATNSICTLLYERPSEKTLDGGRFFELPSSPDYKDFLEIYVKEGWYEGHYRADRGFPLLDRGQTVVVEHDLATEDERKRLRHYHDLYLRWGFPGFAMIGMTVGDQKWCMPFLRGHSQGHFSREDGEALASMVPHLGRILSLTQKLAIGHAQSALNLLERLAHPAFLTDRNGRVLRCNPAAEALVGHGLLVKQGHLSCEDRASSQRLSAAIAAAATAPKASEITFPPLAVRRIGQMPLILDVVPAIGALGDLLGRNLALILVSALDRPKGPSEDVLRQAFSLTKAEARLARHLTMGGTLEDAADRFGITLNTARSTLKAIFTKTDTRRQAELVALLSRLAR